MKLKGERQMTFKIKNHQLNNRAFVGALKELGQCNLEAKVAWNVKRMLKQFDKALSQAGQTYSKVVHEFCQKDENGKLIPQNDSEGNPIPNSFTFETPEKEQEFQDRMKDFMVQEYTIESYMLKPEDFEGAKLSATDLTLLEPIIEE